jgi:hypothetical protein
VVPRDPQYELLTEQVDGVDHANLGQASEGKTAQNVAFGDGPDGRIGYIDEL